MGIGTLVTCLLIAGKAKGRGGKHRKMMMTCKCSLKETISENGPQWQRLRKRGESEDM
ncbi:uncharacterized protein G2W53_030755 [Senna tora]|uniref:Uncharacterized protein n=1 Tax=Senna tora TaxID=362788 RepID=A0A834WEV9_9FABA|nr:uncharacterized protein G2W53_030755 [Senna tora]